MFPDVLIKELPQMLAVETNNSVASQEPTLERGLGLTIPRTATGNIRYFPFVRRSNFSIFALSGIHLLAVHVSVKIRRTSHLRLRHPVPTSPVEHQREPSYLRRL